MFPRADTVFLTLLVLVPLIVALLAMRETVHAILEIVVRALGGI